MSVKITVKNAAENEAEWIYTNDVMLCTEIPPYGRSTYTEKLASTLTAGERVCHKPGKPCHPMEVVSVEEI